MMKMKNKIGIAAIILIGLNLTGCDSGGSGGGSTPATTCNNQTGYYGASSGYNNQQACAYNNGAYGAYGAPNGAYIAGAPGGGVGLMDVSDGTVVIALNRDRNAVNHWAIANNLCNSAVNGAQVAFDCLSIANAVLSFHVDKNDSQFQPMAREARWRVRMTDQFGRPAISEVFEGRAIRIGNGFQIQSGSTVVTVNAGVGGAGVWTVTVSYRMVGGPIFTLGSGTMRMTVI